MIAEIQMHGSRRKLEHVRSEYRFGVQRRGRCGQRKGRHERIADLENHRSEPRHAAIVGRQVDQAGSGSVADRGGRPKDV